MTDKLADFALKFGPLAPVPREEIQRINERHAGDIWIVTVCHLCGRIEYGMRIGCTNRDCDGASQFGHVKHEYRAKSGQLLKPDAGCHIEHGKDFLFIDERPSEDA